MKLTIAHDLARGEDWDNDYSYAVLAQLELGNVPAALAARLADTLCAELARELDVPHPHLVTFLWDDGEATLHLDSEPADLKPF